jgi:hypothetical protein
VVVGKIWEKKRAESRDVTIKKPVPTVVTREEPAWATRPELVEHVERTEKQVAEVWDAIQTERGIAREALSRIHARLDMQSNATASLQGTVNEVKGSVGRLLDLALQRKAQREEE